MRNLTKLVLPAALAALVAMSSVAFAIHPPEKPGDAKAAPAAAAEVKPGEDPLLAGADIDRGRKMFQDKGCVGCHGWDGDGLGKNPRSNSFAALLRETTLDAAGIIETIQCGRPGTGMPFHDTAAYRDDRCYGMKMDDFEKGLGPIKGMTMPMKEMVNIAAFITADIKGKGKTTLEDCQKFFGASAEKACTAFAE